MKENRMTMTLDSEPAPAAVVQTLEERVIARLRTVFDPEIPVNIYDLGLIYKIALTPAAEGRFDLRIDMTLTAPGCPVAGQMPGMVEHAVTGLAELNNIDVDLVWDPPWDKSRMSDEARLQLNFF
jgi:FeS assembly SUF system protein